MNREIFSRAMLLFVQWWTTLYPGLNCLLLCDNLEAHRDAEGLRHATSHGAHVFFLPPNTSHFLQPLDDKVFAIYKTCLRKFGNKLNMKFGKMRQKLAGHASSVITAATPMAEHIAFSDKHIQEAFKNTGIYPWNPELILTQARKNVGQMTTVQRLIFIAQ